MSREIPELDRKGLRNFAWMFAAVVASLFGLILPWLLSRDWPWEPWVIAADVFRLGPDRHPVLCNLSIAYGCVSGLL